MKIASKEEQETIITYDRLLDQWHYYSDVPEHNKQWDEIISKPSRRETNEAGKIALLEGNLDGYPSLHRSARTIQANAETELNTDF